MEIVNEVKQKDVEKQKFVHRNLAEVQRAKLDKLMKNPEKPVLIPESTKRDKEYVAPSFVRNVMGSSAGAGSGEFHVYRHLRRKEYARQKYLKMQSETERLNEEFQGRKEDNQKKADEKTDKKRAKRLKKKQKARANAKKAKKNDEKSESASENSDLSGNEEEANESDTSAQNDIHEEAPIDKPNGISSEAREHQENNTETPTDVNTAD